MNNTLSDVWHEVEKLLEDGISVIPVRDKDDGNNIAKSPYATWKQFQSRRIEKQELWRDMEKFNTCAVGILGGKVSGNLYVIDIDVKYKPGIDAVLFQDFKKLYPDIFEKVRIHKSPSGGFHIIYRCECEVEGNLKLAGRPATEDELQKSKQKVYNFLETRGEGGYVLAPPSLGYKIVKNCPIPTLTLIEHQSIINLCRSYNEIIKVEKPPKPTISEQTYYDENPFDDFNRRVDPTALMTELGWSEFKSSSRFVWYTRPGKNKGISMSFNHEKRFFFCFTASSELEENHGYTPSNLVATVLFGGDKKKVHQYLVQKGYGKVKPRIEAKQVKQRVLTGQPLPENFSEEAKRQASEQAEALQEQNPFGIFWEPDDDGKIVISRERLYKVCDGLGFKLFDGELYRVVNQFIYKQTKRDFFDEIKRYINDDDPEMYESICNSYEAFVEAHGSFTVDRLSILDADLVMKDNRDVCNKFFKNCYLEITKDRVTEHQYKDLEKLVFYDRVQNRDYSRRDKSDYIDFLQKATGGITEHLRKIVGFLAHEYKDETMAYIIVCVETCPDPKNGGGSGKNVFCDLFKYSTTYISKPGSQSKMDEKFFQTWSGQKLFGISDLPENFDFAFLKELSSGTMVWKRLFKDEVIIGPDKAPKILTQTNFSYKVSDGGLRRRIIPIEFTEFFTRAGGLDMHYGKHFPHDWTKQDWNGYDTFIADSVKTWLSGGRKLSPVELSGTGWEKQFVHEYGQTVHDIIKEYWDQWINSDKGIVRNDVFKHQVETYYVANAISINFRPSMARINKGIEAYAKKHHIFFNKEHVVREVNGTKKVKFFGKDTPF